jgi:hypothetical protein
LFGYVRINKPELKFKDYEAYRAVYCSLCRVLGKRYSVFSRAFLNYDLTFLALFKLSVSDSELSFKKGRCPFNPFKKCNFTNVESKELSDAADATVIMSYYKVKDNLTDKGFKNKVAALLMLPFSYAAFKKAKRLNPEVFSIIENAIDSQTENEKDAADNKDCSLIDKAAHSSATAISSLISANTHDEAQKIAVARFGYNIGRFVYLIDALDDLEDDMKRNNFNPYCSIKDVSIEEIRQKAKGDLVLTANQAVNTYNSIEKKRFTAVLDNIIYEGLYSEISRVFDRRKANEPKSL